MNRHSLYCMLAFLAVLQLTLGGAVALAENPFLHFEGGNRPVGDTAVRVSPDKLKKITAADAARIDQSMLNYVAKDETLVRNAARSFYYYEQLSPAAMEIYDIMLMIAEDPATPENYGVMMTDMDPESDEYYYEMLRAYFAMTYDHPELFWLYGGAETSIGFFSEAMPMNGLYLVYYKLLSPYTKYQTQMTAFNRAADAFLADIDRNASDYEIVRQIHDKLIDLVTYDTYVLNNLEEEGQNLAHTAYGALVANSQGVANRAVCDGYSLAFEYLLQQCGIEAVVVAGNAGPNEAEAGGHAWNMVKLDGSWYEVDSTWDDAGTVEAKLQPDMDGYNMYREAITDRDYRDKMQHYLFLLSTDTFRDYDPGDSYRYYTRDGRGYVQMVGPSVHIRFTNDGTINPYNADPSVIALAPMAFVNYIPLRY